MSDKAKSRLMIAGAALCAALFLCGKDEHSAVAEKIFRRCIQSLSDFLHDFIFCWLSTAQLVILNCPRSNRDFFCKSGLCQVGFHSLFSQPVFESHKAPLSKIFCEHEQNFR